MMKNIDEIKSLFRARYSLLYLVSHEEERMVNDILNVAKAMKFAVYSWSFSSGIKALLVPPNGSSCTVKQTLKDGDCTGNPVTILDMVDACKYNAVFILKDYHAYLKEAEISRKIRDVLSNLKVVYTPLVIVSPVMKIPMELEKATTIVDYLLPTREEIHEVVYNICETLASKDRPVPDEKGKEDIIRACQGLTLTEIENVVTRSLAEHGKIECSAVSEAKRQIIRKSGILEFCEVSEDMSRVGGMDVLKQWLMERHAAFSDKARDFGLPTPKGIMLFGVPGCGKSLICKAISNYWKMPLLRLDVGAVMQGLVGSSEENMRKVIQTAESISPCVLWVDEIEKGFSGTGSSNFSDAGTTSRVFSTFITWLNEKKSEVFVVATANDITQLPPELMRKGRFDDLFFVDLPNFEERKEIFKIHLQRVKRDPSKFNLDTLAENTNGFSGADISEVITDSLFNVFVNDEGRIDITDINIINAIKKAVPLSKVMASQIAKIRELSKDKRARLASSGNGG